MKTVLHRLLESLALFCVFVAAQPAPAAPSAQSFVWIDNDRAQERIQMPVETLQPTLDEGVEPACEPPLNPTRVMLFLDFNASEKEVQAAQRAACRRGEGYVHAPGIQHLTVIGPMLKRIFFDHEETNRLERIKDKTPEIKDRLKTLYTRKSDLDKKVRQYSDDNKLNMVDALNAALLEIKTKGQILSSMVISGHHAGGQFYGESYVGTLDSEEVWTILNAYPEVTGQLTILALWGCDSVTPFDSKVYKLNLPSLKVIAGFYDTAPAGQRAASYGYLESVLVKESEIQALGDVGLMRRGLGVIDHLFETFSALYIQTTENKELFFNMEETDESSLENVKVEARYRNFEEALGCEYFDSIVADRMRIVSAYSKGERDTPTDKRTSDLRALYDFARQNPDCLEKSKFSLYTGDYLGFLLFFDGVKINFARVFKDLIRKAAAEYTELNEESFRVYYQPVLNTAKNRIVLKRQEIQQVADTFENTIQQLQKNTQIESEQLHATIKGLGKKRQALFLTAFDSPNCAALRRGVLDSPDGLSAFEYQSHLLNCQLTRVALINSLKPRLQEKYGRLFLAHQRVLEGLASVQKNKDLRASRRVQDDKEMRSLERALSDVESQVASLIQSVTHRSPLPAMDEAGMSLLTRKQVLENIRLLESARNAVVTLSQINPEGAQLTSGIQNIVELKEKMKVYLEDLDAACMGFVEWHEARPANAPQAQCR